MGIESFSQTSHTYPTSSTYTSAQIDSASISSAPTAKSSTSASDLQGISLIDGRVTATDAELLEALNTLQGKSTNFANVLSQARASERLKEIIPSDLNYTVSELNRAVRNDLGGPIGVFFETMADMLDELSGHKPIRLPLLKTASNATATIMDLLDKSTTQDLTGAEQSELNSALKELRTATENAGIALETLKQEISTLKNTTIPNLEKEVDKREDALKDAKAEEKEALEDLQNTSKDSKKYDKVKEAYDEAVSNRQAAESALNRAEDAVDAAKTDLKNKEALEDDYEEVNGVLKMLSELVSMAQIAVTTSDDVTTLFNKIFFQFPIFIHIPDATTICQNLTNDALFDLSNLLLAQVALELAKKLEAAEEAFAKAQEEQEQRTKLSKSDDQLKAEAQGVAQTDNNVGVPTTDNTTPIPSANNVDAGDTLSAIRETLLVFAKQILPQEDLQKIQEDPKMLSTLLLEKLGAQDFSPDKTKSLTESLGVDPIFLSQEIQKDLSAKSLSLDELHTLFNDTVATREDVSDKIALQKQVASIPRDAV